MYIDTRYTVTFSRQEIVAALKTHHPTSLVVQAIPDGGTDRNTTPTMSLSGDALHLAWTRIGKEP